MPNPPVALDKNSLQLVVWLLIVIASGASTVLVGLLRHEVKAHIERLSKLEIKVQALERHDEQAAHEAITGEGCEKIRRQCRSEMMGNLSKTDYKFQSMSEHQDGVMTALSGIRDQMKSNAELAAKSDLVLAEGLISVAMAVSADCTEVVRLRDIIRDEIVKPKFNFAGRGDGRD